MFYSTRMFLYITFQMEWNRQQVVHKWEPFVMQQMQPIQQQQQQLQQQHQLPTQHQQQHPQPQPQQQQMQQQQQQLQPPTLQMPHMGAPKAARTGGSTTPHCLICNVHLGMFAKGGMEVFSEKVLWIFAFLCTVVLMEIHHPCISNL